VGGLLGGAVTTAGVAGDLRCGAGKGGNGRRRGRFAWRRGKFALRRGQGWQRPVTREFRLAARLTTAGGAGDSPCGTGSSCLAAQLTTAGGAGDASCGAGKGGNGRRRGQLALRLRTDEVRVYIQVPA